MKKIAIIGAGLAGTSLAYVLKQAGMEPVILETGNEIAPGASGNLIGLYNPRFSADWTPQAQFYSAACFKALETFEQLAEINWDPCGTLHLITDGKKARRFPKTLQNWGWEPEDMRLLTAREAAEIAGIKIVHDALYLPRGGSVCPQKLCRAYAQGIEVHLNTPVEDLQSVRKKYAADVLVIAGGMGTLRFLECKTLPLKPVRGQVTLVKAEEKTETLRCNLCYGGYISRSVEGVHVIGSTFQPWLNHSDTIDQDDADNIGRLRAAVPALRDVDFAITGQRAAVRTGAKDRFPVVGKLADSLYISTGHGSHGIISALMSAHILRDMIAGHAPTCPQEVLKALSPRRFEA